MFKSLKQKWKNRRNRRLIQKNVATDFSNRFQASKSFDESRSNVRQVDQTISSRPDSRQVDQTFSNRPGFHQGDQTISSRRLNVLPHFSVSSPFLASPSHSTVSSNPANSLFSLFTLNSQTSNQSFGRDLDVLYSSGYNSLKPSATDLSSSTESLGSSLNSSLDSSLESEINESYSALNLYGNDDDWIQGDWIGRGSQAKVYTMTHKYKSDLRCVMKVVELSREESDIKKIRREYDMLSHLDHPRIIKYLWYTIDPTIREAKIFMEQMQQSLKDEIQKNGCLTTAEATIICYQILEGLAYMHNKQIIHRDIKSANILLDQNFSVKISDFGISRQCTNVFQTQTRTVLGTYHYMSPEAIIGKYNCKADIWSVGCTIVDMLSGNPPNSELQDIQALFRVGNEKVAKYSLPTMTSLVMVEFVALLLEPEAEDRPSAAKALENPVFYRFKTDQK